jgi:hypothetical protein
MNRLKNPYRGINAHLNSQLQNTGDWSDFHTLFIATLRTHLTQLATPKGYRVSTEKSHQIRVSDTSWSVRTRYPDVAIYNPNPIATSAVVLSPQRLLLPLDELLSEDELDIYFRSIALYNGQNKLVAWIELLSPSNKLPESAYYQFVEKRKDILRSQATYIEIDFLHQQPPTFKKIPDYSKHQVGSYPYRMVVIPDASQENDNAIVIHVGIDEAIPVLDIALSPQDTISCDLDAVYQKVFEDNLLGQDIDYLQVPMQFNTYSPQDCRKIWQVMENIQPTH